MPDPELAESERVLRLQGNRVVRIQLRRAGHGSQPAAQILLGAIMSVPALLVSLDYIPVV